MSPEDRLKHYFNALDIDAMGELRALAEADACDLVVVAHGVAAVFFPGPIRDAPYVRARRQFFGLLAERLGARLIYDIEDFTAPQFAITDSVHLNRYGAEQFTALVARRLDESVDVSPDPTAKPRHHPVLTDMPSDDITVSAFSALIPGPPTGKARTLQLRILLNHAIPVLPSGPLSVMLRLPDGSDLMAPARFTSAAVVQASFDEVTARPRDLLLARLVADIGGRTVALNQRSASTRGSKASSACFSTPSTS